MSISDLHEFSDGVLLIQLLEVISNGKKINRYNKRPRLISQKIDNVSIAIAFMNNTLGLKVIGCNPAAFVDGNLHHILGVLFLLTKYNRTGTQNSLLNSFRISLPSFFTLLTQYIKMINQKYKLQLILRRKLNLPNNSNNKKLPILKMNVNEKKRKNNKNYRNNNNKKMLLTNKNKN